MGSRLEGTFDRVAAGVAHALERPHRDERDVGSEEVGLCRFVGSKSVLKYFLLSSGKTVTTAASGPSSSWSCGAPRKFAPEEIPTPSPRSVASLIAGCCSLRNRPTPMIVPPVPTPATNASGNKPRNRNCHQISGPVVW